LTISLNTAGGIATPLVLRGTPLPATRTQTFSTAEDNQKVVTIRLAMGERPLAKYCEELAKIDLGEIPQAPRGEPRIELTVIVDRNCRLSVVAKETRSQKGLEASINEPKINLDQNAIQLMIDQAEENRESDQAELRDIEARNKAHLLLAQAEARLKMSAGLSLSNLEKLNKAVAKLGLAVQSDQIENIRAASTGVESALSQQQSDVFSDIFSDIFAAKKPSASFATHPPRSPSKAREDRENSERPLTSEPTVVSHAVFGTRVFTLDPSLCFVLMPFKESLKPIYEDHIRGVVEGESLTCVRADDIVGVQQITTDIWEHVNRARFIIADLTDMNANVFYELGLAHALAKPVILLTQSIDHVPFDLKAHRCLVYDYTPRGMHALEQKLRRTIRDILNA